MQIVGKKIEFFRQLFEDAKNKRDNDEKFDLWRAQYEGTEKSYKGIELKLTRNITYELIESQISTQIPSAKVTAERWSEQAERRAIRTERFLNALRNKLPFEEMNDMDERSTYIYGASPWAVEWDDSLGNDRERGGVVVTQYSIEDFVPQPGLYRIEDMDYCFLIRSTTEEDVIRRYGVSPKESAKTEKEADRISDDDTVDVITCWYRGAEDEVCLYVFSGEVELSDIDDYYSRKERICKKCGKKEGVCLCREPSYALVNVNYEELTHDITLSDGDTLPCVIPDVKNGKIRTRKAKVPASLLAALEAAKGSVQEGTELAPGQKAKEPSAMTDELVEIDVPIFKKNRVAWYKPTFFPVILRKNVSRENSIYGQSDCEIVRPQQIEINKILSRLHEKMMAATRIPYKPEDSSFTWDNSIGTQVLNLRPNELPSQYGVIDTSYVPSADLLLINDQYEAAKRTLGISASYQGQSDSSAQSGYAKQVQVAQSAGRLESKRAMKNAAYANIDRAIFELYLAFSDEPRPIAYKDEMGRIHNESFNRYDFLEYDAERGEYYYDDRLLFSAELTNPVENQREMLWQLNQNNLSSGTFGDPSDPRTMLRYWQQQEKAHYPDAVYNVEYFQALAAKAQMQSQAVGSFSAEVPAGMNEAKTKAQKTKDTASGSGRSENTNNSVNTGLKT